MSFVWQSAHLARQTEEPCPVGLEVFSDRSEEMDNQSPFLAIRVPRVPPEVRLGRERAQAAKVWTWYPELVRLLFLGLRPEPACS